jgi:hypothetical protein
MGPNEHRGAGMSLRLDLEELARKCRAVEDRISALHKMQCLRNYDSVLAELRTIRRDLFDIRQNLDIAEAMRGHRIQR